MTFEISDNELSELYSRAHASYRQCIRNPENSFLQQEISEPIESLKLIDSRISLVFYGNESDSHVLEVRLNLEDSFGNQIGRYEYIVDEVGNVVDDMLVFY